MSISDSPMTSVRIRFPSAQGWGANRPYRWDRRVVTVQTLGRLAIPPAVSEYWQREYDQGTRQRGILVREADRRTAGWCTDEDATVSGALVVLTLPILADCGRYSEPSQRLNGHDAPVPPIGSIGAPPLSRRKPYAHAVTVQTLGRLAIPPAVSEYW